MEWQGLHKRDLKQKKMINYGLNWNNNLKMVWHLPNVSFKF